MDLAAANAAHFSRFFDLMGKSPRAVRGEGEGWVTVVSGAPHPLGNYAIVQKGTSFKEAARAFDAVQSPDYPSAIFYTVAEAEPDQHEALLARSYDLAGQLPLMAAALRELPPPRAIDGVECRRIRPEELEDWTESLAVGYGLPLLLGQLCADTAQFGTDAEDSPMQFFGVFENGRIVSTSQLFLYNDIAGIYCVATLPESRRKGYGALATFHPLLVAKGLGYETAILQASTMGLSVYERIGFRTAGTSAFYLRVP